MAHASFRPRRRCLGAMLGVAVLVAATAGISPASAATAQDRCNRLVRTIRYPWPRLGFRLECTQGVDAAKTFYGERRIHVSVSPRWSDWTLTRVIAHEMGHAVEWYSMVRPSDYAARRRLWYAIRGVDPSISWWGARCTGCRPVSGSEDFAEVFAVWQLGRTTPWYSGLAPPPGATTQRPALVPFFDPALIH